MIKLTPATKRLMDILNVSRDDRDDRDDSDDRDNSDRMAHIIDDNINMAIKEGLHLPDEELARLLNLNIDELRKRKAIVIKKNLNHIIMLNYNKSAKELAAMCNISESAIRMRISRMNKKNGKRTGRYGHPQTEETRRKIRESLLKRKAS